MHNRSKDHCSPKYDVPLRQRQSPFPRYSRGCCINYRGNTVNSKPITAVYYREFQSHSRGNTANVSRFSSHARAPIAVKFCTAKRTHVPLGCAKFNVNRCHESPLRGSAKMLIFGLWVNLIPAPCRFAAKLPVKTHKHHTFAPTADARCSISPNFAWW